MMHKTIIQRCAPKYLNESLKNIRAIKNAHDDIFLTFQYGFNSCGPNIVCIAPMGINNESRKKTVDANDKTADYRCEYALVIRIFDALNPCNTVCKTESKSPFDGVTTVYEVGKIVRPDSSNYNLDNTSNGIHYFKSVEAAYYFGKYDWRNNVSAQKSIAYSVEYDTDGQVKSESIQVILKHCDTHCGTHCDTHNVDCDKPYAVRMHIIYQEYWNPVIGSPHIQLCLGELSPEYKPLSTNESFHICTSPLCRNKNQCWNDKMHFYKTHVYTNLYVDAAFTAINAALELEQQNGIGTAIMQTLKGDRLALFRYDGNKKDLESGEMVDIYEKNPHDEKDEDEFIDFVKLIDSGEMIDVNEKNPHDEKDEDDFSSYLKLIKSGEMIDINEKKSYDFFSFKINKEWRND